MKLPCNFCGIELDTTSKQAALRVTGWVSPRTGGGTNHIRYMSPSQTGEWAHVACLEEAYQPAKGNQASLFEDTRKPPVTGRDFARKSRKSS